MDSVIKTEYFWKLKRIAQVLNIKLNQIIKRTK